MIRRGKLHEASVLFTDIMQQKVSDRLAEEKKSVFKEDADADAKEKDDDLEEGYGAPNFGHGKIKTGGTMGSSSTKPAKKKITEDEDGKTVCPNCDQWVHPRKDGKPGDCMNACRARGFAEARVVKEESVAMECMECGKTFKSANTSDPKCPKCGGYDIDIA